MHKNVHSSRGNTDIPFFSALPQLSVIFIKHGKEGKVAILIVYVDDIVVTGNDVAEIQNLKKHLASSFDIKALGLLSYFLGIEVAYSASGIVLSQHKYIIDLLKDTVVLL